MRLKYEPASVEGLVTHKGPYVGYPVFVLGAVCSFLEPFCGHLSPNIDNVSEKLTLRYPHEGPWVARTEGLVVACLYLASLLGTTARVSPPRRKHSPLNPNPNPLLTNNSTRSPPKPKPLTLHPHPKPDTLRSTPYTLHPTPYTLRPTPYPPNPQPLTPTAQQRWRPWDSGSSRHTLDPAPCTLNPAPCTLNPAP